MSTKLSGSLTRLVVGVFSTFGNETRRGRELVVTLVPHHDTEREGGIYIRGKGMAESSARFISWRNAIYWAHKPNGRVARRWRKLEQEKTPDYPAAYADVVRALQAGYPDRWQRILDTLAIHPPRSKEEKSIEPDDAATSEDELVEQEPENMEP
jgi:hypothetical protein